jgi:hypothetical protein
LRRPTSDPTEELEPHWSRDGHWIYFGSNRTGSFEVWKMPAAGGAATQVTRGGGAVARESLDGRFLYYVKPVSPSTIWRVPVGGRDDVQVVDGLSYPQNFVVSDNGIYFVAIGDAPSKTSIDFFDSRTGVRTTRTAIGKPWWFGIALSPDQRWLLFPTINREGRDLMLVDSVW